MSIAIISNGIHVLLHTVSQLKLTFRICIKQFAACKLIKFIKPKILYNSLVSHIILF